MTPVLLDLPTKTLYIGIMKLIFCFANDSNQLGLVAWRYLLPFFVLNRLIVFLLHKLSLNITVKYNPLYFADDNQLGLAD